MKKNLTILFLFFFCFTFSQEQTKKWNSITKRYEYFDSRGNLIGYEKYNDILRQWEYFDSKRKNKYENYNKNIDDFYADLNNDQDQTIAYLMELKRQQIIAAQQNNYNRQLQNNSSSNYSNNSQNTNVEKSSKNSEVTLLWKSLFEYYNSKNYSSIISTVSQLENYIENNLQNVEITNTMYLLKVISFLNTNKYKDAADYCTKIIQNNKYEYLGEIYYYRALSRSKMKEYLVSNFDYEYLIENFKKLNFGTDRLGTVYNNIAYNCVALEQYLKAKEYVEKALVLDTEKDYIWDTKGELEYKLGNYNESIQAMNKAINIRGIGNSYLYRGLSYIKQNKKSEGCNDLAKAISLGEKQALEFKNKYCK